MNKVASRFLIFFIYGIKSFIKIFSVLLLLSFFVFLYFVFTTVSFADFGTISNSYEFAETNALATAFCSMISFLQKVIVPVAGISLSVAGIAAFQGKINPIMLLSLALGLAVISDPGIFVNILLPGMNFQFGCKCMTSKSVYMRSSSNSQNWQKMNISTGVDENCNKIAK